MSLYYLNGYLLSTDGSDLVSLDTTNGGTENTQIATGYNSGTTITRTTIVFKTPNNNVVQVDPETLDVVKEYKVPEEVELVVIDPESELIFVSDEEIFIAPADFEVFKQGNTFWVLTDNDEDSSLTEYNHLFIKTKTISIGNIDNGLAVSYDNKVYVVHRPNGILTEYPGGRVVKNLQAAHGYDEYSDMRFWNNHIVLGTYGSKLYAYDFSGNLAWDFNSTALYASGYRIRWMQWMWHVVRQSSQGLQFILYGQNTHWLATLNTDFEISLVELPGQHSTWGSFATDTFGNVYVYGRILEDPSEEYGLTKFNRDGSIKWQLFYDEILAKLAEHWGSGYINVRHLVAPSYGVVIAHTRNGLLALSGETGNTLWAVDTGTDLYTNYGVVLPNDTVVVPGRVDAGYLLYNTAYTAVTKHGQIVANPIVALSNMASGNAYYPTIMNFAGEYELLSVNDTLGNSDSELPVFHVISGSSQSPSASVVLPVLDSNGLGLQSPAASIDFPVPDVDSVAVQSAAASIVLPGMQVQSDSTCKALSTGEAQFSLPTFTVNAGEWLKAQINATFDSLNGQAYASSPGNRIASALPKFNGSAHVTAGETGGILGSNLVSLEGSLTTGLSLKESFPSLSGSIEASRLTQGDIVASLPALGGHTHLGSLIDSLFPMIKGSTNASVQYSANVDSRFPSFAGSLGASTQVHCNIDRVLPSFKSFFTAQTGFSSDLVAQWPMLQGAVSTQVLEQASLSGQMPRLSGQWNIQTEVSALLIAKFPVFVSGMQSYKGSSRILRHVRNEVN